MREMVVLGVRVSVPGNEVVVVLGVPGGDVVLPIVIGPREGAAIASAQAGLVPPRPLTHDLLMNVVKRLGASVTQVRVTKVEDGVFYAELVLSGGVVVDSRPSDAIALALRAGCPVLCAEDLLAVAGVPVRDAGLEVTEEGPENSREMEEFREFLARVEPEDFADPGEGGGPEGPGGRPGESGPRGR
ncbi:bifunctional nuclease family protein [Georgenia sp. TF02-10]|uniref:bifunctional nuclease family protein n=1 Tax=Georgenia sp. TF02-10 TaxID=2917725 RepID=UPI001FA7BB0A|nr:bifunctional nuclease family protein [Georgenia sp. TF02-10]UNX53159.1 bifunctional nuclease family protein [Georgenia sp. TF02-10]